MINTDEKMFVIWRLEVEYGSHDVGQSMTYRVLGTPGGIAKIVLDLQEHIAEELKQLADDDSKPETFRITSATQMQGDKIEFISDMAMDFLQQIRRP